MKGSCGALIENLKFTVSRAARNVLSIMQNIAIQKRKPRSKSGVGDALSASSLDTSVLDEPSSEVTGLGSSDIGFE